MLLPPISITTCVGVGPDLEVGSASGGTERVTGVPVIDGQVEAFLPHPLRARSAKNKQRKNVYRLIVGFIM
jgi:hypothetical protein